MTVHEANNKVSKKEVRMMVLIDLYKFYIVIQGATNIHVDFLRGFDVHQKMLGFMTSGCKLTHLNKQT